MECYCTATSSVLQPSAAACMHGRNNLVVMRVSTLSRLCANFQRLLFSRETALLIDPKNSCSSSRQWVALVVGHELAHQWFGNLVTMVTSPNLLSVIRKKIEPSDSHNIRRNVIKTPFSAENQARKRE